MLLSFLACVPHPAETETTPSTPADTGTPDTAASDGSAKWTFLVYLDGDNDLEGYVMHDLDEIEAGGTSADVRVFVLADRAEGHAENGGDWTGTRLYEIVGDGPAGTFTSPVLEDWGERDMADPATLTEFLERVAELSPSERYALALWDHGTSFYADAQPPPGIAWDDGSEDEISIADGELDAALTPFTAEHGPFALLAFDACNMAYFEIGHALRHHADYLVAAQTFVGWGGLQYTPAIATAIADPAIDARDLADQLAREPVEDGGELTFSALDLSKMDALAEAVDAFAGAALADPEAWDALVEARAAARGAEPGDQHRLWSMDLFDLVGLAEEHPALETTASSLRDAATLSVVGAYAVEDFAWTGGIDLYADTNGLTTYGSGAGATWAQATRWDEVLLRLKEEGD